METPTLLSCTPILLPTQEASNIVLRSVRPELYYHDEPLKVRENSGYENQHLYLTSKREIKEGDWFINMDFKDASKVLKLSKGNLPLEANCFKIEATTDIKLHKEWDEEGENVLSFNNVPLIGKEVLKEYVRRYQDKNVDVYKLSDELYQWSDPHIEGDITKVDSKLLVEWFKIKLQDNADKKFTLEDMRNIMNIGMSLRQDQLNGYASVSGEEKLQEYIKSVNKEQGQIKEVSIEMEQFNPAIADDDLSYDGMTAFYKIKTNEQNEAIIHFSK